jgi:hypothetical protein
MNDTGKFSLDDVDIIEKLKSLSSDEGGAKCRFCKGLGYTPDKDGKAVICACAKKTRYANIFSSCGIPPKYHFKNLDDNVWYPHQDYQHRDIDEKSKNKKAFIKAFAIKYINVIPALCAITPMPFKLKINNVTVREVVNVLFSGSRNTGKSLMAAIIAQEVIKKGLRTHYFDWLDLKVVLKDFDQKETHMDIIHKFESYDLIIIDNVGGDDDDSKKISPYLVEKMDQIFNARKNANKPTLLVCDNNYKDIKLGRYFKEFIDGCFSVEFPKGAE